MILFYDTETTGLVNFKAPSSDSSQPRLVQIGMIVCEDSGEEVFQFGAMVVPKDHSIPKDMIHGIDHNKATLCGVGLETVLPIFSYWMGRCDLHVCHNFIFDKKVMESELIRIGFGYLESPYFCTMQSMTGVCKLRQATSNRFKWPKLQEAYKHISGKNFNKAHDALADVRACKEIYFWLKNRDSNQETGTHEVGLDRNNVVNNLSNGMIESETISNHGLPNDRLQIDNSAHLSVLPISNIDFSNETKNSFFCFANICPSYWMHCCFSK